MRNRVFLLAGMALVLAGLAVGAVGCGKGGCGPEEPDEADEVTCGKGTHEKDGKCVPNT